MSRARHEEAERRRGGRVEEEEKRRRGGKVEKRAEGGDIEDKGKPEAYDAKGSRVLEEAEKRRRGGKVSHGKMPHFVEGHARHHLGNRPGRKSGGSVGADAHPLTSAARLTSREGGLRAGTDKEDD